MNFCPQSKAIISREVFVHNKRKREKERLENLFWNHFEHLKGINISECSTTMFFTRFFTQMRRNFQGLFSVIMTSRFAFMNSTLMRRNSIHS